MSDVVTDEWDRAYEEGKEAGLSEAWSGEYTYRMLMDRVRSRAIHDCIDNLTTYIDQIHNHEGDLTCLPGQGDTCDVSAAVRVAVNRLKAML